MNFDQWWDGDSSERIATPETFRGWRESCRQSWDAALKYATPTNDQIQQVIEHLDSLGFILCKKEPVAWMNPTNKVVISGFQKLRSDTSDYPRFSEPLHSAAPAYAMSKQKPNPGMCQNWLRQIGKPYPRTCQECGLTGPCKFAQPYAMLNAAEKGVE